MNWDKAEYKLPPCRSYPKKSIRRAEFDRESLDHYLAPIKKLDELVKLCDIDIQIHYRELRNMGQVNHTTCLEILERVLKGRSNDKRIIKQMNTKLQKEKRSKTMYKSKYNMLKCKFNQLRAPPDQETDNDPVLTHIQQFYRKQLEIQARNEAPDCKRPSYPEDMYPFYVLLSFAGEHWYCFLRKLLGLPSYRSVQKYRKLLLEKHHLDKPANFDGSVQLIQELKNSL